MSEHYEPGSVVLVEHLDRAGPVKATVVRKMTWACPECGGVARLCDVVGHGAYTVCANSIRRLN